MRVALAVTAVFIAVAIAYVGPKVAEHRDPMLVYLRDRGQARKADLIPAFVQANTPRSVVRERFNECGFRGPVKMSPGPDGKLYADEAYYYRNLLRPYTIFFVYDDDGKVIKAWGLTYPPGAK